MQPKEAVLKQFTLSEYKCQYIKGQKTTETFYINIQAQFLGKKNTKKKVYKINYL